MWNVRISCEICSSSVNSRFKFRNIFYINSSVNSSLNFRMNSAPIALSISAYSASISVSTPVSISELISVSILAWILRQFHRQSQSVFNVNLSMNFTVNSMHAPALRPGFCLVPNLEYPPAYPGIASMMDQIMVVCLRRIVQSIS